MRRHHPKVSPRHLQRVLGDELRGLIPWTSIGRSLGVEAVLRLLSLMIGWRASLHAVMDRIGLPCCENTVRLGLLRQLPDLADLSARLSVRLIRLMGRQPSRGFHIAIDTHYSPYYGDGSDAGVVRGQLKASTRKFFVYATAAIVERGRRYTLAVTAVESGHPDAALEPLLRYLSEQRVKIRSLTLDKGFYAAAVFARLHRQRIPYVAAVPHNRRALKRFFHDRTESSAHYQLRSGATAPISAEATLRLRRVRYHRDGRWRTEVYAVHRLGRISDDCLRAHYRRHFAIESSYRQLREIKPTTTSKNRAWRLLLVGLALLFRQLWVILDAARLKAPQRMPRLSLKKLAWLTAIAFVQFTNTTSHRTSPCDINKC